MIGSLQSLRFFFAGMIFLHHFIVNGEGLFNAGGPCGVSFFMILSGFVMFVGYGSKVQMHSFSYKNFLYKRIIRIYPLHLLCLLGFLILHRFFLSLFDYLTLLPNLLLLQSWIPQSSYYFSGNAVSWCLSCMLFFYMAFPFIVSRLNKYSRCKLCIIGLLVMMMYFFLLYFLPDKWEHPILYISPLLRVLDFIIGILLCRLYYMLEERGVGAKLRSYSFRTKSLLELFPVFLLSVMLLLYSDIPQRYTYASYWWFVMPLFILIFALFNKSGGGNIPIVKLSFFTFIM